jgi:RNA polymerase sigma factor (sigma-70 family)
MAQTDRVPVSVASHDGSLPDYCAPVTLPTDVCVARWQGGDEEAFEILHTRFAPLLAARIRRHKNWRSIAARHQLEDVVQEAWARVVPASKKGFTASGPGSFLAFVGQVTDNTVIDLVRREMALKRGTGVPARSLDADAELRMSPLPGRADVESPTEHVRRSELDEIARNELSEREYSSWSLVEIMGYTAAETGLALDCTGAAVRGLVLRARSKLILRLESEA